MQAATNHTVDVALAGILLVGSALGAQLGARAAQRLQGAQLKVAFSVLVLAMALKMLNGLLTHARRAARGAGGPVMGARWPAVALAFLVCCGPRGAWAQAARDDAGALRNLTVSDRDIRVTPRYSGELVKVRGTVAPGCDVVVRLSAPGRTVACSRMGKVGPFWLSVGRVRFGNVPSMYKVKSTRSLLAILAPQEQLRYRLGFRGLRASLTVQGGPPSELDLNELITVRTAAGLYAVAGTGVTLDRGRFATTFFWPAGAPEGRYEVEALAVRDQRVVGARSVAVEVHVVGVEAFVRALAQTHGVVYGLIAVLLAGAVGALMSVLFELLWRRGRRRPPGRFIPTRGA